MIQLLRLFGILPLRRPVYVRVFELRTVGGIVTIEARAYSIGASGDLTFVGSYADPSELLRVYAHGSWTGLQEVAA